MLCTVWCSSTSADTPKDIRLIVFSSPNSSGGYEPVPPDVPLPENITYSLRSPELGFVVIDTDPNETEYISNQLLNLPWVEDLERDVERTSGKITSSEERYNNSSDQWGFHRIGIDSIPISEINQTPCKIAVIDTGINRTHPDIGTIGGGYDWVNQNSVPEDLDGHGTALAGIITQIAGNSSSPDSNCSVQLIPERIGLSHESLPSSFSALAIAHAADADADIILMGYGGSEPSLAEERAIAYAHTKGALLIAPAGNEDSNTMHFPSDDFDVISVGSIAKTDGLSYFSNYGIYTELVAPGEEIVVANSDGGYSIGTGTSFAAAEVTGIAVLLKSVYPALTADEIRSVLQSSATDLGRTGRDIYYGYGLVNAPSALKSAADVNLQKTLNSYSNENKRQVRRIQEQGSYIAHSLPLVTGWNYISFPAPLRSQKTCRDLFSQINTDGHTIWTYRGNSGWTSYEPDASPIPLEGMLVYSEKSSSVPLILENSSSVSLIGRKGWNLVGSTLISDISAKELLKGSNLSWVSILPFNASTQQYEPAIITGAEGTFTDTRIIHPYSAFWIYLDADGTFIRSTGI